MITPHSPHRWTLYEGKYGRPDTLASCLGVDGLKVEESAVTIGKIQEGTVTAETVVGGVIHLWLTCVLVGHKWRWLTRYIRPIDGLSDHGSLVPVAERCQRCEQRRPVNMFRWAMFVHEDRL